MTAKTAKNTKNIFADILQRVRSANDALMVSGDLPAGTDQSRVTVEPPRDPAHGDIATNAAMVLAKDAARKPRDLAEALAAKLRADELVAKVDVAGPGFINLTLKPAAWIEALRGAVHLGAQYGTGDLGGGLPVNVEYVSANPTGPMHIGHCRGAVFGDALANLLAFTGYEVTREYYINDAGAQVDQLARSAYQRYLEALGHEFAISEGLYPGDYLKPVGRHLKALYDNKLLSQPESQWLPIVRQVTVEAMLVKILEDLDALNIEFDVFFSEKSLSEAIVEYAPQVGKPTFYCASKSYDLMETPPGGIRTYLTRRVAARAGIGPATFGFSERPPPGELRRPDFLDSTLRQLQTRELIYSGRLPPPKGAPVEDWEDREQTLFRSTEFGDDVDRPLKKSDGSYTYFASDIAYHRSKLERGFRSLIDVWGADHGGYIKRMKAAVAALSGRAVALDVKIVQLVKLLRAGEPVKMSKRAGEFVTLREVVDEVGSDAVRFMMLYRKNDAVLDFDLAKVIEQSRDNPVFYVQYGHARGQSVFRNARAVFTDLPEDVASLVDGAELDRLADPAELALMRQIALYPRVVEAAAAAHEPHRIAFYLYDLASEFHALYTLGNTASHLRFIIQNDRELTVARLVLVQGVVTVLASGLKLLGVEAPSEMR
jgi:arginyl-tRNA synthetase